MCISTRAVSQRQAVVLFVDHAASGRGRGLERVGPIYHVHNQTTSDTLLPRYLKIISMRIS